MAEPTTTATEIIWGDGRRTFVLLHYFSGAAESWRWVAEQLPGFRCVALQLPGAGGTASPEEPSMEWYADWVAAQIARLKIEDYVLVGHSMGAKIALPAALQAATPPRRVVMLAPSPPTRERMPSDQKEQMLHGHHAREHARGSIAGATVRALTDEQTATAVRTHTGTDNGLWRWWLLEGMDRSVADQVRTLDVPVTVLASEDDPIIPFEDIGTEVMGTLPHAQLHTTRGSGHLLPLEDPGWVAAQLREAYSA
ncbi:MAG: alpha/beta hydrolase [Catalinimonas sp.]